MPDGLLNGAGHLPPEVEFGYERGLLTPAEILRVHEHLAACDGCRERLAARLDVGSMVANLRDSIGAEPRSSGLGRWALALAAALAFAVGAVWLARRAAPNAAGMPEDGAAATALRTGRMPVPAFLGQLAPPQEVLMGGGTVAPAPPAGLSPAATAVLVDRPRFSWEGIPAGGTFQVRVFTLEGEPVASSPPLTGTSWIPDRPLARGRDYQWQLNVVRGDEGSTLPAPPDSPPRFRVLDAAEESRVRALAASRPGDRLSLAVELAKVGAVDAARSELDAVLRREPGRRDVRRLREGLDRR